MVSNFSVVSLFKINMLPTGDSTVKPITGAEIEKVKKLCALEAAQPEYENIQPLVERENAFVETYQNDIAPQRQERIEMHKTRLERKANIQNELMEEEETRQRILAEQRDQEFAAKLRAEERSKLEEQKRKQAEEMNKD